MNPTKLVFIFWHKYVYFQLLAVVAYTKYTSIKGNKRPARRRPWSFSVEGCDGEGWMRQWRYGQVWSCWFGGARSAKAVMSAWLNLNMASQVLKLSLSSPPSYSSLSRLNPLLKNDEHHYWGQMTNWQLIINIAFSSCPPISKKTEDPSWEISKMWGQED